MLLHAPLDECPGLLATRSLGPDDHQPERGGVGDASGVVREEHEVEGVGDPRALGEDLPHLRPGMFLHVGGVQGRPAVGEEAVEVGLGGESVLVSFDGQVVAGVPEDLDGGLGVPDVESRLPHREADLRQGGPLPDQPPAGLEEDGGGDLPVDARPTEGLRDLGVEALGEGLLTGDVGDDRRVQLLAPQLLEHGGPEELVVQRRRAHAHQRVRVGTRVPLGVGDRHPLGQQPQDPPGPLEGLGDA